MVGSYIFFKGIHIHHFILLPYLWCLQMRDAIIDLLKRGNCPKMMAFANAAWIRVSIGTDEVVHHHFIL